MKTNKIKEPSSLATVQDLWNLQAEQSVIGGLLLEPNHLDDLLGLDKSHFYHIPHQIIFEALQALYQKNKACDLIMLIDTLRVKQQIDAMGGENYLWEMANNTPTTANIFSYAGIIREKWVLRSLSKACQSVLQKIHSPEDMSVEEKIDFAETQIFNLRAEPHLHAVSEKSGRDLLPELFFQWDNPNPTHHGKLTGFSELDEITQGLKPSQLVILAARPSMGKTTLALNIATHIALKEPVLLFSLETPASDLFTKVISSEKKIPLSQLQKGAIQDKDWSDLYSITDSPVLDHLFFEEPHRLSIQDMRSKIRRFIRKQGGVGLVVVDYLQLMSIPGYNANQRVAEISEISRGLKAIAREFKIPVLALSQLNRELERRPDKRPMMADLRESGSIEQDADLILFIYRDEVYNPETAVKGATEILIAKHRNGQTGRVNLSFDGQFGQFSNKGC